MSIGLAIQQIGILTMAYQHASTQVLRVQQLLAGAAFRAGMQPGGIANNPDIANLQAELSMWTFLQGLFKDFLEFWKNTLKDTMAIIKSFNELAQGSR